MIGKLLQHRLITHPLRVELDIERPGVYDGRDKDVIVIVLNVWPGGHGIDFYWLAGGDTWLSSRLGNGQAGTGSTFIGLQGGDT
jgi:hypothetical protein